MSVPFPVPPIVIEKFLVLSCKELLTVAVADPVAIGWLCPESNTHRSPWVPTYTPALLDASTSVMFCKSKVSLKTVSYTHLTLPTTKQV